MLYFFHHYELPALLPQAHLQLGRLHTMNIVLRNVPATPDTNANNAEDGPATRRGPAGPTPAGDAPGAAAPPREAGLRGATVGIDYPQIVNLFLRSMTATATRRAAGGAGAGRGVSLRLLLQNHLRNIGAHFQPRNTDEAGSPPSEPAAAAQRGDTSSEEGSSPSSGSQGQEEASQVEETSPPVAAAEAAQGPSSNEMGESKRTCHLGEENASAGKQRGEASNRAPDLMEEASGKGPPGEEPPPFNPTVD